MDPAAIARARAHLRIDGGHEDAVLDGLLGTALALCERFTGQVPIRRTLSETRSVTGDWQRLTVMPVTAITGVAAVAGDGSVAALPVGGYAIELDGAGGGWVRVSQAGVRRMRVTAEAGLAADWAGLPEPVAHGIVRLAAHLFSHRDAADEAGPPAVIAALWRPYRRMRLR